MPGSSDAKPISGTSYAAPVVAGIAALIRSHSPQLSARQVMKRIEDTAHEPGAGWDPRVGEGVVDPVAAVSADGTGGASRPQANGTSPGTRQCGRHRRRWQVSHVRLRGRSDLCGRGRRGHDHLDGSATAATRRRHGRLMLRQNSIRVPAAGERGRARGAGAGSDNPRSRAAASSRMPNTTPSSLTRNRVPARHRHRRGSRPRARVHCGPRGRRRGRRSDRRRRPGRV